MRAVGWDERLKLGEHTDFFLRGKAAGLVCGVRGVRPLMGAKTISAAVRTGLCIAVLSAWAACSDDPPSDDEGSGGTSGSAGRAGSASGKGGSAPSAGGMSAAGSSGSSAQRAGRSGSDMTSGRGAPSGGAAAGGAGAAGTFVPPEECSTAADCDDDDPCTDQACGSDGECEYTNNEATCDDGDECTTDDVCSAGVCSGAPACGGGCDCAEPAITPVAAGFGHTCARKSDGLIRCWGDNYVGETGYGPGEPTGEDIDVGRPVLQLALGSHHSCALLQGGAVRCWGNIGRGRLGYGNTESIGDDPGEVAASGGDLDLGGEAMSLDASTEHSCAALVDGTVRCWGGGAANLGYGDGDTADVGNMITPAERGVVDVGGRAVQIAAGEHNTCALLANGDVRCWGVANGLGAPSLFPIGDDESPGSVPPLDLGGAATQIGVGDWHACALLEDKTVRCWGRGEYGELGYGDTETVGDDETPRAKGAVDVGGPVIQIAVGFDHTCALLEDRSVRCWGKAEWGRLGYGNVDNIGDDETPGSLPEGVDVGGEVEYLSAGGVHNCALLTSGALRCWGEGSTGTLGYESTDDIGDDEVPSSAGDVPWFD